jgi:hypothetical protein
MRRDTLAFVNVVLGIMFLGVSMWSRHDLIWFFIWGLIGWLQYLLVLL